MLKIQNFQQQKYFSAIYIILSFLLLFDSVKSNAQPGLEGKFLTQEIQIRIPLIDNFPKALIIISFGLESFKDSENISIGKGFGIILSGTFAKVGNRTFGAFGGGLYARGRFGYKLTKNKYDADVENSPVLDDIHYILSSPEISFIYLFGSTNYALLELGTDIGYGYYMAADQYFFTGELLRLGVRPASDNNFFFATSYPKFGILTKEK